VENEDEVKRNKPQKEKRAIKLSFLLIRDCLQVTIQSTFISI
jgi:hypothetical protein